MKIDIHSAILTLDSFRQRLKDLGITPNHSLLLACSGGSDSMCLADLLIKAGCTFSVAHVNYGLRGAESDTDMEFIRFYCSQHQIPFYLLEAQGMIQDVGNIQEQARDVRYAWFEELLSTHGLDFILTAHHMNDQAETILLNLIRGTGLNGLSGMQDAKGKRIRPLLPYSKSAILRYCADYGISYREDSTNAELKYTRNKIRHSVFPIISEINPKAIEHIAQLADRVSFSQYALKEFIEKLNNKHRQVRQTGEVEYDFSEFTETAFLTDYLFYEMHTYGFNYEQINSLCNQLPFVSGKTAHANSYQLITQAFKLFLIKSPDTTSSSIGIHALPFHYSTPHFSIDIDLINAGTLWSFRQENTLFIAADDFTDTFPDISLDYWKEGDLFQPMGMHGTKKLSDYFTDKKIPVHIRSTIPLIRINNLVAALIPYTIHEQFRITQHTRSVMRIHYKTKKAVE